MLNCYIIYTIKLFKNFSVPGVVAAFLVTSQASAGTMSVDTVYVSTFSGQAASNGITLSSYVYIVSGSSLTLQGASGYITTASSVNAAAFFGDGSHLAGMGNNILNATQTFTGGNTFTSSFTVQSGGRQIILSTSSSVNNINIDPNGNVSFYPMLHNSSSTTIPGYTSYFNTSFAGCIPGSTITITTSGGKVETAFTGVIDAAGGAIAFATFLQDGAFVGNLSATKALAKGSEDSGSFSYLLAAPSAGTHSYCLGIWNSDPNSQAILESVGISNIFYAVEIK